ncbi:MAG TPA: hypothetical protein VHP83_11055 [Aggregatilineaceae bacterium]|nr:hypothetical protein [Aggregatilineaceae bacterium]
MIRRWLVLVGLVMIAGCTLQTGENADPETITRDDVAGMLAEVRADQAAALTFWDRIIFGETVGCQEYFIVPTLYELSSEDRAAHPEAEAIVDQINLAAQSLQLSAAYWDSECADGRSTVPLEVAREGRTYGLAAGVALDEAARLLAEWPQE